MDSGSYISVGRKVDLRHWVASRRANPITSPAAGRCPQLSGRTGLLLKDEGSGLVSRGNCEQTDSGIVSELAYGCWARTQDLCALQLGVWSTSCDPTRAFSSVAKSAV